MLGTADRKLIDRWLVRSDREEMWTTLRRSISAPALIRLELTARRKAEATARQLYGFKQKGPSSDEIRRLREKWRADWRPPPSDFIGPPAPVNLVQIAGDTEIIGLRREWQKVWEELRHPSPATPELLDRAQNLLLWYSDALDERPRKREDYDTCRRRVFWISVSEHLKIQSGGKPFDREVAALTEIAFNLEKGSVNIKDITEARRRWRAEQH